MQIQTTSSWLTQCRYMPNLVFAKGNTDSCVLWNHIFFSILFTVACIRCVSCHESFAGARRLDKFARYANNSLLHSCWRQCKAWFYFLLEGRLLCFAMSIGSCLQYHHHVCMLVHVIPHLTNFSSLVT